MTDCNGWTNRATWVVAHTLAQSEAHANHTNALARQAWRDSAEYGSPIPGLSMRDDTKLRLAQTLRGHVEDGLDEAMSEIEDKTSLDSDAWNIMAGLMRVGFGEVNWPEIAAHYVNNNEPVTT